MFHLGSSTDKDRYVHEAIFKFISIMTSHDEVDILNRSGLLIIHNTNKVA